MIFFSGLVYNRWTVTGLLLVHQKKKVNCNNWSAVWEGAGVGRERWKFIFQNVKIALLTSSISLWWRVSCISSYSLPASKFSYFFHIPLNVLHHYCTLFCSKYFNFVFILIMLKYRNKSYHTNFRIAYLHYRTESFRIQLWLLYLAESLIILLLS